MTPAGDQKFRDEARDIYFCFHLFVYLLVHMLNEYSFLWRPEEGIRSTGAGV